MPTMKDIADSIRMHRARLRLSRDGLAERCGIPAATIASYENELANISLTNACKLADALGVTLDELAGRNH